MGAEVVIAAVGAAFAAKGAIDQKKAAEEAASAREESEKRQQRIRDLQTARERRKQVAQARIQRAQILAGAGAAGTTETSSFVGGTGSISSKAAGNIGFINQTQALSQQASLFNQQAADAQGREAQAQALGGVGKTLFSTGIDLGAGDSFKSFFKKT